MSAETNSRTKTNHYVVIRENRWGASITLSKAFANAGFHFINPFEACCHEIEFANQDRLLNVSEINDEIREVHDDVTYNDGDEYDFMIIITDDQRWRFTGCDSIDGSPHYDFIGEGEMPGELERIRLAGRVSECTGLITITESFSNPAATEYITAKPGGSNANVTSHR